MVFFEIGGEINGCDGGWRDHAGGRSTAGHWAEGSLRTSVRRIVGNRPQLERDGMRKSAHARSSCFRTVMKVSFIICANAGQVL